MRASRVVVAPRIAHSILLSPRAVSRADGGSLAFRTTEWPLASAWDKTVRCLVNAPHPARCQNLFALSGDALVLGDQLAEPINSTDSRSRDVGVRIIKS